MGALIAGMMGIIMLPLLLLARYGGIVAAIWLGVIGQWKIVGAALILFFCRRLLLSILFFPTLIFAPFIMRCSENRNWSGLLFCGFLSQLLSHICILIWCFGILLLFLAPATRDSFIPCFLMAYSVSIGTLSQAAAADAEHNPDGSLAATTTSFAMLAYLIVALFEFIPGLESPGAIIIFAGAMVISFILSILSTIAFIQKEKSSSGID